MYSCLTVPECVFPAPFASPYMGFGPRCVAIALTMLKKWPPSQGLPPQHEAKEFFQTHLEALYRDKAPSPV